MKWNNLNITPCIEYGENKGSPSICPPLQDKSVIKYLISIFSK